MDTNSTATYDKRTHKIIYTDLPVLYEEVRNTFSKVSCDLTAQHKYQLFIYDIANFISSAEKEYEYVSNIKREIDKSEVLTAPIGETLNNIKEEPLNEDDKAA